MAFELYRDNVGSVAGEIDIPFVGAVTSVLPGRPNFSISDDNGTLMVSEMTLPMRRLVRSRA